MSTAEQFKLTHYPTSLSAFLLFLVAMRLFDKSGSRFWDVGLSVLVGMTGAAGLSQVGATTNEWQPALLCLAGLAFVRRLLPPRELDPWDACAAGVLIGLATGIKLTAVTFAVGATVGLFVIGLQIGHWKRLLAPFCVGGAIGFFVFGAPWCIVLYMKFGNPFFPFFNNIFHSDWFSPTSAADMRFFPRSISEWLFYPFYWAFTKSIHASELHVRDPRVALALLSSVIILVSSRRMEWHRKFRWQFVAIFFLVSYLVWLTRFSIYRYVIPLEVLAGPLIVGAVQLIIKHSVARIIAATTISVGIVVITVAPDWGHIAFGNRTWSVEKPEIPSDSLVVLGRGGPIGALVPLFPPDARFVRGFFISGVQLWNDESGRPGRAFLLGADVHVGAHRRGRLRG